jgi:hypothetical protein
MLRFGAIVRFFMLTACLVPFTSERQMAGALTPIIPLSLASFAGETVPVSEEDDERETDPKELSAAAAKHHAAREPNAVLPHNFAARPARSLLARATPPAPVDHFRNGLGSPYRC